MHRSVSLVFAAVAVGAMALVASGSGCSSSSNPAAAQDTGNGGCDPQCDPGATIDPTNPPASCGPCGLSPQPPKNVTCPSNACMYQSAQSGTTLNYRMGRIRLWSPSALLSLAALAVNPNVNPTCFKNGAETFNWLLQVDKSTNMLTTGGAAVSADHKTFAFLDQTVSGAGLSAICAAFTGGSDIHIQPIKLPIHFDGNTFKTDQIDLVNIPIFDTTGVPVILPIREGVLKNVTISADNNCIGAFDPNYAWDGDTLGWTTGGVLTGYITAEDADNVPVKTAGCQSLCAILANDATKISNNKCKRDSTTGKIVDGAAKDHTSDGTPAFLLSATFSAYGVDISGTSSGDSGPGDTGATDTGAADTGGSDSATDATGD